MFCTFSGHRRDVPRPSFRSNVYAKYAFPGYEFGPMLGQVCKAMRHNNVVSACDVPISLGDSKTVLLCYKIKQQIADLTSKGGAHMLAGLRAVASTYEIVLLLKRLCNMVRRTLLT